ncbi:lipase family protein [Gordonia sp. HS-NH1]|uniref:lipase family protein n=1 Tax=Gordonia sp. HS-NH1 TaxID=1435068 RepID=UPI0009FC89BF|nr:lipase family protein [Gordonia sp. HS-NH1]
MTVTLTAKDKSRAAGRRLASGLLVVGMACAAVLTGAAPSWAAPSEGSVTVSHAVPRIIDTEMVADRTVALPQADSTLRVRYTSTSIRGVPTVMSGTLLTPPTPPPAGGWPLAVWNHMTVGAADACAPSVAHAGHSELPRMTSGDGIVARLLDAGFVVVRPDFEGIGGPGPHPYLIGDSLARSAIDMALAAADHDPRIGRNVVVAGHSEGAVAALSAAARPSSEWGPLRLRAVSALAPPTRVADLLDGASNVPVAGPAVNELMGLAALIGSGAAAADPAFDELMDNGGLSARARELRPQVETRCYADLTAADSFGGLAPTQLLGPRGEEMKQRLLTTLRNNDVARLRFSKALPVRVDSGIVDTVSPQPLVAGLVDTYRRSGVSVTYTDHFTGHPGVATDPRNAATIADWLIGRV